MSEVTTVSRVRDHVVEIRTDSIVLEGNLSVPEGATGIVLFVHGSGSSRLSPRNRYVAKMLREGGLGTLLFDLLTAEEERIDMRTRHLRFDIDLLTMRVIRATKWIAQYPDTEALRIGYFGSSTGAAAALMAAAELPVTVGAVVSRGGRPDLAGTALARLEAPTLLIVGGNDLPVINLNRRAMEKMAVEKKLEIIPNAGHLFEEPGSLAHVVRLARRWFKHYLGFER